MSIIVDFIMAEIWNGASKVSATSRDSKADCFATNGDKNLSPHLVRATQVN